MIRSQCSRHCFLVASVLLFAILVMTTTARAQARRGGRGGGVRGSGGFQGFGGDGFSGGNMNRANSYARSGGYGSQREYNPPERSSANQQARYNQYNSQQQAKYNQLNTMQANRHNYKQQQQYQRAATVNANIGESNWNGGDGDDNSGEALGAAAIGAVGGMAIGSRMAAPPAQNPYPPPPSSAGYYAPPPAPTGSTPYYYGGQVEYPY